MQIDQTNSNNTFKDDKINLKELFDLFSEGKFLIILITSVFALSSIFYALSLNNYYRSEAILTVYESSSAGRSLDRINELERFAADVSHELKNPLASLKTSNELLAENKINPTRIISIFILYFRNMLAKNMLNFILWLQYN